MSEDLSSFVDQNWRSAYENGKISAGYEAALFCIANGQTFPAWLAPLAAKAIKRDFVTSEGRGRGGVPAFKDSRKASLQSFILAEVNRLHSRGTPKTHAFGLVASDLSKHDAKFWTAEMIKTEYYRKR